MSKKIDFMGATMIEFDQPQFVKLGKKDSARVIEKNKNDIDLIDGLKVKVINVIELNEYFAFFVLNDDVYCRPLLGIEFFLWRKNPSALSSIFSRQIDEIRGEASS